MKRIILEMKQKIYSRAKSSTFPNQLPWATITDMQQKFSRPEHHFPNQEIYTWSSTRMSIRIVTQVPQQEGLQPKEGNPEDGSAVGKGWSTIHSNSGKDGAAEPCVLFQ